jgi:DNA repair exonuclease SbcCD ATPase subunit
MNKTKAFSSSLIEQDHSEGNGQFHGYLLWNIKNNTVIERQVKNNHGYFTVVVNRFTDFDNLHLNIDSKVENKRIRVKWRTLPAVKDVENTRKVDTYLQNQYTPLSIKHVADFIDEKKIVVEEQSDIENISKRETLHKVISEYLLKIGTKQDIIDEVLELDVEIENRLVIEDLTNIEWDILSLKAKNFRSYNDLNIDWDGQDGLYQIVGENGAGKSTLNQLITYIAFGKSLETDFKKKFGEARYINNKNGATLCEGSMIFNANGEYYGIKRVTTTKRNKEGEMTAASTVASYYKLTCATDSLEDQFNIEKLNDLDRHSTQKRIDEIIGTYENFIRVTLTTSDTLNGVLSSDKAFFIDSLLNDSGCNIFDLRTKEFKEYKSQLVIDNNLSKVVVVKEENAIKDFHSNINLQTELGATTDDKILNEKSKITQLNEQKETLQQSMHQIDAELSTIDENQIVLNIKKFKNDLAVLEQQEENMDQMIKCLLPVYDVLSLKTLENKKESHKTNEFEKRNLIIKHKLEIEQVNNAISKINGEIELMKKQGSQIKNEIFGLENSKTCPTCGQLKTEHTIDHIKESIKLKEVSMFEIADKIKAKIAEKPPLSEKITAIQNAILQIQQQIEKDSTEFQSVLLEIGKLNNAKEEVERRDRLMVDFQAFPLKKENIRLKISEQEDKLTRFNNQKNMIQENVRLRGEINKLNILINNSQDEIHDLNNSLQSIKNFIDNCKELIKQKERLIKDYLDFERKEQVRAIYSQVIHRDGLPTQILTDILLPRINATLSTLLEQADFDVYLDKDDLRLKFHYNSHPDAVIDTISSSGMERTFAVFALKIALNQVNSKSKPTFIFFDEITGKLKNDRLNDFLELLQVAKKYYKKVFIIEHHDVNPDFIIEAIKENGISKINFQ